MSKLLAGTHYDPAGAVSKATTALQAMTAFDISNLRLTFNAPDNGIVRVDLRCAQTGATTSPTVLLGVLDGATVRGRALPIAARPGNSAANQYLGYRTSFLVKNLTAGQSYSWDAAYGVEFAVAATNIKYGGPDDSTQTNAFGAFSYEIYDTPGLLNGVHYDPVGAVTGSSLASLSAMAPIDTTNLRLAFNAPQSRKVLVRIRCGTGNATSFNQTILWGVMEGATVRKRARGDGGVVALDASALATQTYVFDTRLLIDNLVAGQLYTWDAAYGVELAQAAGVIAYGGPDDAIQNNAWGGFAYEIWDAVPADVQPIIRRRRLF